MKHPEDRAAVGIAQLLRRSVRAVHSRAVAGLGGQLVHPGGVVIDHALRESSAQLDIEEDVPSGGEARLVRQVRGSLSVETPLGRGQCSRGARGAAWDLLADENRGEAPPHALQGGEFGHPGGVALAGSGGEVEAGPGEIGIREQPLHAGIAWIPEHVEPRVSSHALPLLHVPVGGITGNGLSWRLPIVSWTVSPQGRAEVQTVGIHLLAQGRDTTTG